MTKKRRKGSPVENVVDTADLQAEIKALQEQVSILTAKRPVPMTMDRFNAVIDMVQPIQGAIILRGWSQLSPVHVSLHAPGRATVDGQWLRLHRPELAEHHGSDAVEYGFAAFFLLGEALSVEQFRDTTVSLVMPSDVRQILRIADAGVERLERDAKCWNVFPRFLGTLDHTSRVIEVGSRARLGTTIRHHLKGEYLGIDIKEGPNVDLVADAHFLTDFVKDRTFTHAVSASVFEHLLCPIQAASELNAVLDDGALVYISTHQTWPVHEHPWDYFRFSDSSWHAVFNHVTGFEVIEARLGDELSVVPVSERGNPALNRLADHNGAFATSVVLARKIAASSLKRLFSPDDLRRIYQGSYPY